MKNKFLSILLIFTAIYSHGQRTIPGGGTSGQVLTISGGTGKLIWSTPATAAAWGGISGTLSSQTDLQNALNLKLNKSDTLHLTFSTPIRRNGDVISIPAATSSVNGYLSYLDWTTFNSKQAALVSATNIKTINGSSILGSGDLTVTDATKLPLAGGTMTGDIQTSANIRPTVNYGQNLGQAAKMFDKVYCYELNIYNSKLRITETSNIATLFGTSGIDFSNIGNYNLRMGTDGHNKFPTSPPLTANYGLASFGNGAFDGTTAGFFTGSANGTVIAANITGSADLVNLEKSGVNRFKVDNDGNTTAVKYCLTDLNTAPASASATGTKGEIRVTATYIYVCTATNTWVRAALSTW